MIKIIIFLIMSGSLLFAHEPQWQPDTLETEYDVSAITQDFRNLAGDLKNKAGVNDDNEFTGENTFLGRVGIGTTIPLRKFHVEDKATTFVALFKNTHASLGHGVLIYAGDSASEYILHLVDKDGTSRFRFMADGTGKADVAWITFSPDIRKDLEISTPTASNYLQWALSDAKKEHKPYEGILGTKEESDLYGKDAAKIAIGTAMWAEWAMQKITELEQRIEELEGP